MFGDLKSYKSFYIITYVTHQVISGTTPNPVENGKFSILIYKDAT